MASERKMITPVMRTTRRKLKAKIVVFAQCIVGSFSTSMVHAWAQNIVP
jgi:hypothetical protein